MAAMIFFDPSTGTSGWEWEDDGGRKRPYAPEDAVLLERMHSEHGPGSIVVTKGFSFNKGRTPGHRVDFAAMTQTNIATGVSRAIYRGGDGDGELDGGGKEGASPALQLLQLQLLQRMLQMPGARLRSSTAPCGGGRRCRAPGCREAHARHYCRYCKDQDSNHRSRDCRRAGKEYTMYHGTTAANAVSIRRNGFKASPDGLLGRGVYCTRVKSKAADFVKGDPQGVIFTLRVRVGNVKMIDHQGHPMQKSWQQSGYDTAWVPSKTLTGITENCVKDPRRIRIVGETAV